MYYKYYNAEGLSCKVKIEDEFEDKRVVLSLKYPKDERGVMHIPDKIFKNGYHVINYICKNLETDKLVVSVSPQHAK